MPAVMPDMRALRTFLRIHPEYDERLAALQVRLLREGVDEPDWALNLMILRRWITPCVAGTPGCVASDDGRLFIITRRGEAVAQEILA